MPSLPRRTTALWYSVRRLKTASLTEHAYTKEEARFHTIFDLVLVGFNVLPLTLFALCGYVSKDIAGPSGILSALFAAMASGLAGLSYSELRTRVSRLQAPAYEYMYRVMGELVGFTVGWTLLLHHVALSSTASRVMSESFDYLLDQRLSNLTLGVVGDLPRLNSSLDPLSPLVCLLAAVALTAEASLDTRKSRICVTSLSLLVLLFALVASLYHLDFANWQTVDKFFPHRISGVLCGAAVLVSVFWSSESILRSCDLNSRAVKRPALTSILVVHISLMALVILLVSSLTLLAGGSWDLQDSSPFSDAFSRAGLLWMRYIICPAALLMLPATLLREMRQAVRLVRLMSTDGLLPAALSARYLSTESAVWAVAVVAILSALGGLLLSVADLIQMVAVPVVVVHVAACIITILFHYKPHSQHIKSLTQRRNKRFKSTSTGPPAGPEARYGATTSPSDPGSVEHIESHQSADVQTGAISVHCTVADNNNKPTTSDAVTSDSDTDIDDIVEEYTQEQLVRQLAESSSRAGGWSRTSSPVSYSRVRAALGVFMVCAVVLGVVVTAGSDSLTACSVPVVLLLVVVLVTLVITAVVIARQAQDAVEPYTVRLHVPHVPWTPLVAIVMNVMMLVSVGLLANVMSLVWSVLGLGVYILYGFRHSHEAHRSDQVPAEHRGLIPNSDQSQSVSSSKLADDTDSLNYARPETSQDDVVLLDCS